MNKINMICAAVFGVLFVASGNLLAITAVNSSLCSKERYNELHEHMVHVCRTMAEFPPCEEMQNTATCSTLQKVIDASESCVFAETQLSMECFGKEDHDSEGYRKAEHNFSACQRAYAEKMC